MAKQEPDIKTVAAEIAKGLMAKTRQCRVCQIEKDHPRAVAIMTALLEQGVPMTKAGEWLAKEVGSKQTLSESISGHRRHP